jgi:hypothetical protein
VLHRSSHLSLAFSSVEYFVYVNSQQAVALSSITYK